MNPEYEAMKSLKEEIKNLREERDHEPCECCKDGASIMEIPFWFGSLGSITIKLKIYSTENPWYDLDMSVYRSGNLWSNDLVGHVMRKIEYCPFCGRRLNK